MLALLNSKILIRVQLFSEGSKSLFSPLFDFFPRHVTQAELQLPKGKVVDFASYSPHFP